MQRSRALAIALATALAGCVFVEKDPGSWDSAWMAPGTGAVSGQAFLKTRSGDMKYGAGNVIYLVPMAGEGAEIFERSIKDRHDATPLDLSSVPAVQKGYGDAEGRFRIDRVPPGDYYLACRITWESESTQIIGGWAYARLKVAEGRETKAIVTRW